MESRRVWKVSGIALAVALVTLPLTVPVTKAVIREWQWRSVTLSRSEAKSLIDARVREVAAAWQAMPRTTRLGGFMPQQELTLLPASGLPEELASLVQTSEYWLQADSPARHPDDGTIHFANGDSMVVPLVSARQAFSDLSQAECPPPGSYVAPWQPAPWPQHFCVALPVTGVQFGAVSLHTNRGPATAPAWLFTVTGLPGPVARVAVATLAITASPVVPPMSDPLDQVLRGPEFLDEVDGVTVRFRAYRGCGDKVIGTVAHETSEVVVIGIQTQPQRDVQCAAVEVPPEPFSLTLASPVGSRSLVAPSGRLVPYPVPGTIQPIQLSRLSTPKEPLEPV